MLKSLWNDEVGVILSAELVLIGSILTLGIIVGMVELQVAIVGEFNDLSTAFGNVSQSYQLAGFESTLATTGQLKSRTHGSAYNDGPDLCDEEGGITIMCSDAGEVLK